MSSARARANHQLYLARIVVDSWQQALARQEIAANTLNQAFCVGARNHLMDAYGWFLLEIVEPTALPETPPHNCSELPAMAKGKAVPGEIHEFEQLESGGWLGEMLAQPQNGPVSGRLRHNLAVASSETPGPDQVEQWLRQLAALFERMSDSLDEY